MSRVWETLKNVLGIAVAGAAAVIVAYLCFELCYWIHITWPERSDTISFLELFEGLIRALSWAISGLIMLLCIIASILAPFIVLWQIVLLVVGRLPDGSKP